MQRVVSNSERKAIEKGGGSLNAFIVAEEIRETDPREPESSEGGHRVNGTAEGKHRGDIEPL